MSDDMYRRMAGNYEITMNIHIGGRTVVFGVDPDSADRYLCGYYSANELLGEYSENVVGGDYAQMIKLFGQRIQAQADRVLTDRQGITVPLIQITAEDCCPNDYSQSIQDKVVAIKAECLPPEYRTADHQLMLVTGGFGSQANARGSACFGINLYTGEHIRWERFSVQGVVKPERLPDWAVKRLAEVQQKQAERKKNSNAHMR